MRFGPVAVLEAAEEEAREQEVDDDAESRELALSLTDELDATAYVLAEARRGVVARSEADAVVRILAAQLDRHDLPQAASTEDPGVYPQFHAVNTALLSMAVGTSAGIDHAGRHRLGLAALLHDIGMTQLPEELSGRESLSDQDRALVESHTARGAKFLIEVGGRSLDLAAAVAFEHHLRPDGNGYPVR
ncbi:MAG TPA: HD domain-containing protein, partial [Gemmatimonadales bacterium]|nr:HD domain-containing protein [Gemmatimonadales bacterium]